MDANLAIIVNMATPVGRSRLEAVRLARVVTLVKIVTVVMCARVVKPVKVVRRVRCLRRCPNPISLHKKIFMI